MDIPVTYDELLAKFKDVLLENVVLQVKLEKALAAAPKEEPASGNAAE